MASNETLIKNSNILSSHRCDLAVLNEKKKPLLLLNWLNATCSWIEFMLHSISSLCQIQIRIEMYVLNPVFEFYSVVNCLIKSLNHEKLIIIFAIKNMKTKKTIWMFRSMWEIYISIEVLNFELFWKWHFLVDNRCAKPFLLVKMNVLNIVNKNKGYMKRSTHS